MDQRILPVGHCHTRSKTDFSLPEEFNARGYFAGIYGPRVYPDMKAETVILKAYGMQPKYFKSLPLHQSQEIIEETPEYTVFKYFLTPDWDFRQDVLSFGTRVEVLEPERVRKEIGEMASALNKLYNNHLARPDEQRTNLKEDN